MNNKFNLIQSIITKKNKIIFFILAFISVSLNILDFNWNEDLNMYDFFLYVFNNPFFALLIITPLVLLFLTKINLSFNNYIFIKFNNKKEWFIYNIKIITKIILLFMFYIVLIIVVIALIKGLDFHNTWSSYSINKFTSLPLILKFNPLLICLIQAFFFYCYLLTLSFLLFIFNIVLKNNIFPYLIALSINFLNFGIFLSKITFGAKISLIHNLFLDLHNLGQSKIYPSIYFSIIFWIFIIIYIPLWGMYFLNKKDFMGKYL